MPALRAPVGTAVLVATLLATAGPARADGPTAAASLHRLAERAHSLYWEVGSDDPDVATGASARFLAALDDVEGELRFSPAPNADPRWTYVRMAFLDGWIAESANVTGNPQLQEALGQRAAGYASQLLSLLHDPRVPPRLWRRLDAREGFLSRPDLLALWLASDPHRPEVLAALAQEVHSPEVRLALLRAASATLPPGELLGRDLALATWLLQERVEALLDLGMATEALAELSAAPEALQALVLDFDPVAEPAIVLDIPGEPVRLGRRDVRLGLAAAYMLQGEAPRADALLAGLPPLEAPSDPDAGTPWFMGRTAQQTKAVDRGAVRWLLALAGFGPEPAAAADPFGYFLEVLEVREGSYFQAALWSRVEALLAEYTGYLQVSRYLLGQSCSGLSFDARQHWEAARLRRFGGLPHAVEAELAAVEAQIDNARAERALEIDRLSSGAPWVFALGCPTAAGTVDAPPAAAPEPILPEGARIEVLTTHGPNSQPLRASHLRPWEVPPTVPMGRAPVALFPSAHETVLLSLPERPDPSFGEDYELRVSRDRGATWEKPHATGISVRYPWEIVAGSPRNRRVGDRLELEAVLFWEDDAVPELEPGARVVISLPLDLLLGDADGDGLTDFEERSIHTDPRAADSDGDGIEDGFDHLVQRDSAPGVDGDLEQVVGVAVREALFFGGRKGAEPADEPASAPIPPTDTSFVAGHGIPLGAFSAPERVVVVDGPYDGLRRVLAITLVELDAERRRAVVFWQDARSVDPYGWGGRLLLERNEEAGNEWRPTYGLFDSGGCIVSSIEYPLH